MTATRSISSSASLFRIALFAAATSLAGYIAYKYATGLHATSGFYAFMFPLSALLAAAGIVLAVKPEKACDCGTTMRAGVAALSVLWLVTGVMCVGALSQSVMTHPAIGLAATFQMLTQHVFLSLSLIAFAWAPQRLVRALSAGPTAQAPNLPGTAAT